MASPQPLPVLGMAAAVLVATAGSIWLLNAKLDHRAHYGVGSHGETDPDSMTNCPACGARTAADGEECRHCGEPLSKGTPT